MVSFLVAAMSYSLTKAKVTSLVFIFVNPLLVFCSEIRANHEFSQQPSLQKMFEPDKGRICGLLYVESTKYESLLALFLVHS